MTPTGRLSVSRPDLQRFPRRSRIGFETLRLRGYVLADIHVERMLAAVFAYGDDPFDAWSAERFGWAP